MNTVSLLLAVLADLIRETLPDMVERLPANTVQKFRDALQAIEQEQDSPSESTRGATADPYESFGLPAEIADLLTMAKNEMSRRAEHDNATAAITDRMARALESLAQGLAAATQKAG